MGFAEGFSSGVSSATALLKAKREKERWDWEKADHERTEGARTTLEGKLQGAETMRDAENTIQSASDVTLTGNKPVKLNANTSSFDNKEDEEKKNYADGGKVGSNKKLKCGEGKSVSAPTHFPGMRFHP